MNYPTKSTTKKIFMLCAISILATACGEKKKQETQGKTEESEIIKVEAKPLVTHMFTADPSAHIFEGRIYIYPSHDYDAGIPEKDDGSHFNMRDYHVFSMDHPSAEVIDLGKVLDVNDVPWASRQMWAPDAAEKDGKYFLYFPAKDKDDIFRIGVATSERPYGPFISESDPIAGSYSIDPSVYKDDDGSYYMYLGGIWGGQLQRWQSGEYDPEGTEPDPDQPALLPKIAKMSDDMLSFAEPLRDVEILDENENLLLEGDNERRFFEAAWIHKHNGTYYLSYSTGDTHNIAYATGNNPYGPFTYQGFILKPVLGWTNHHSIVKFEGKWYLFFHDCELSGGQTHLRNIKMTELFHRPDGSIITMDASVKVE
ncbi:MAG: glycoside hydrolase family 43 protein [Cyclobacteriaceae bacterium]|nr:glycoside hydrolase family 43 protein [Cyclobacteriaceae bacterium]